VNVVSHGKTSFLVEGSEGPFLWEESSMFMLPDCYLRFLSVSFST